MDARKVRNRAKQSQNDRMNTQLPNEERIRAYYQSISAKGKAAMAEKRASGERMYLAPLGYKNARDELGRSVLIPDPQTYPLVQEAKRLRAQGVSIRKICEVMKAKGLRSQRGKAIGVSSMVKILSKCGEKQ